MTCERKHNKNYSLLNSHYSTLRLPSPSSGWSHFDHQFVSATSSRMAASFHSRSSRIALLVASIFVLHRCESLNCSDPVVLDSNGTMCVYFVSMTAYENGEELLLDREWARNVCKNLDDSGQWTLPLLDESDKQIGLHGIMEDRYPYDEPTKTRFWIDIIRSHEYAENWADSYWWQWSNGRKLDPGKALWNGTKPDNNHCRDEPTCQTSSSEADMERCVLAEIAIAPFEFVWYDVLCNLTGRVTQWMQEQELLPQILVCEKLELLSTTETLMTTTANRESATPTSISNKPRALKSQTTTEPTPVETWPWIVLGVCIAVAAIGVLGLVGFCFVKRRHRERKKRSSKAQRALRTDSPSRRRRDHDGSESSDMSERSDNSFAVGYLIRKPAKRSRKFSAKKTSFGLPAKVGKSTTL